MFSPPNDNDFLSQMITKRLNRSQKWYQDLSQQGRVDLIWTSQRKQRLSCVLSL